MSRKTPYGKWPSPISAERTASASINFGSIQIDDGTVYWLERRPSEDGRGVVVRHDPGDGNRDITANDWDVRTLAHEYGGGDFAVHDGEVIFSHFDDQRVYRQAPGAEPVALTPEPPTERGARYADYAISPDGDRCICVRERHYGEDDADEAVNELVRVSMDGGSEPTVLASGRDFYSFPRISPDGRRLAWTAWDHPRMPWDGTELYVADVATDGTLTNERVVMGGTSESIFQPAWSPDGTLHAVSDRSGWWNIYRIEDDEPTVLREESAEYGTPQWVFGLSTYAFLDDGTVVAIRNRGGEHDLVQLDPDTGSADVLDLPFDAYSYPILRSDGNTVAFYGAGPRTPRSVVRWRPGEQPDVLRKAFELDFDEAYISVPTPVRFPSGEDGDVVAHGFYYPPTNPEVEPPADEMVPLITAVHGGPTGQSEPIADLEIQFFTSRGFGVFDVNYRGSTGYGRAYREALNGEWGVVDTEDCVNAARHLVDQGTVDGDRLAIRGSSSGGYATLCALAFHDQFDAGVSYYGIADLERLAEHTHKFESRYIDTLVGPLPEARETYRDRSPSYHANDIAVPLLMLQGEADRVVPASQAELLVDSLVEADTPYAYFEFEDERHGFRRANSRRMALELELAFYAEVFDFTPADDVPSIALTRGERSKQFVSSGDS